MTKKPEKEELIKSPEVCMVPRWQQLKATLDNYDFEEFVKAWKEDPEGVCLDARTPAEFAEYNIPGSININYLSDTLADELETLDPDMRYYICCRSGRRSLRICILLRNMGYTVFNLRDGMKGRY